MTYNKETVIGVLNQIYEVESKRTGKLSEKHEIICRLIRDARDGYYSKPTLEEVWKEKIKTADECKSFRFIFDYEGKIYSTEKEYDTQRWLKPVGIDKL